MVKELEDSPRDEIAVVLDADAAPSPATSFDTQVRAAGSILRDARVARPPGRARRSTPPTPQSVRVSSLDSDWQAALESLAAVEADGRGPVVELLSRESPAARALELVVVTARLSPALVDEARPARRSRTTASPSSGSTRRASPGGRRASSRSCCGCSSRASRSPSCAPATTSRRRCSARPAQEAPCLGRRSRLRAACPRDRGLLGSARGAGGRRRYRPRCAARARAGAPAEPRLAAARLCCRRSWRRSGSPSTPRRSRRARGRDARLLRRRSGRRLTDGLRRASTTCACRSPAPSEPEMHGPDPPRRLRLLPRARARDRRRGGRCSRCSALLRRRRRGRRRSIAPRTGSSSARSSSPPRCGCSPGCGAGRADARRSLPARSSSPLPPRSHLRRRREGGVLGWKRWDPYGRSGAPSGVDYVWDANYDGIEFPAERRPSCASAGRSGAHYWRATTLDRFARRPLDRELTLVASVDRVAVRDHAAARTLRADDPLLPARAPTTRSWIAPGGRDRRARRRRTSSRAAHTGRARRARASARSTYLDGNVAASAAGCERGSEYTVWGYAPQPAAGASSPRPTPTYPTDARATTSSSAAHASDRSAPPGARDGRGALRRRALARARGHTSRSTARPSGVAHRGARTPYGAVVALETWLRATRRLRATTSSRRAALRRAAARRTSSTRDGAATASTSRARWR